jgi:predicted nucleotidyltransferase
MAAMGDAVDRLVDEIRVVLESGPPLRLAVLFGSAARGRLRSDSDLDVAVLPVDALLPLTPELDLQVALERATGRSVDLVRLDQAPTMLRWDIARHGRVLLANPVGELVRFRSEAACENADFAPSFQRAAGLYRKHLLDTTRPGGSAEVKPAP